MIFNVIWEKTDASNESSFEEQLKSMCADVCQYASNAWFVNYEGERSDLFSLLRDAIDDKDTLVVNTVDFNNMSGWMSNIVITWINKLGLSNFKCFDKYIEFDLKRLTVFTGYNGRGKSTVLQSLLLLGQNIHKKEDIETLHVNGSFVELDSFSDIINCNHRADSTVGFHVTSDVPHCEDIRLNYRRNKTKPRMGVLTGLKINHHNYFGKKDSLEDLFKVIKGSTNKDTLGLDKTYPSSIVQVFERFNYISASRLGPTKYEDKSDLTDTNAVGRIGEKSLNVLASSKNLSARVNEHIRYIMDDGEMAVSGNNDSSLVLNLFMKTHVSKNKKVKSINCGYGYQYVLPIIIAATVNKTGCLFIENPEAHLHPKAQTRLLEVICKEIASKGNKLQLLIETHSEHVINSIRLCTLRDDIGLDRENTSFYYFNEDYQVKHLELDENAMFKEWPDGFFDESETMAAEILKLGLLK